MSRFDELCGEIEKLDPLTFGVLLEQKSSKVLVALTALTRDGLSGIQILENFILMSVAADGNLSKKEFELIRPSLELFVGESIRYEDAVKAFNKVKLNSKENRDSVDLLVDILGTLSAELKEDIITICLLICAVDGKITAREKAWIKQLIE